MVLDNNIQRVCTTMADSVFSLVSSLAYPLVIGIISFWAGMKYRESRNEITGEKPKQTLNSPTDDDNEVTNNEYESVSHS